MLFSIVIIAVLIFFHQLLYENVHWLDFSVRLLETAKLSLPYQIIIAIIIVNLFILAVTLRIFYWKAKQ